jgi:hypothetical protein
VRSSVNLLILAATIAYSAGSAHAQTLPKYFAREYLTKTPAAQTPPEETAGPPELIQNGGMATTEFWTLSGASQYYQTFRLNFATPGRISQTTAYKADAGTTYTVSFSYLSAHSDYNPVDLTWSVTAGGTVLRSGALVNDQTGGLSKIKPQGTFVGTGQPVTITITNRNTYAQDVLIDNVSIKR